MRLPTDAVDRRLPWRRGALHAVRQRLGAIASQCGVCGQWARLGLCPQCHGRFVPQVARCSGCGLRLAGQAPGCLRCAAEASPLARTVCAVDYAFPWDRLIGEFKFGQCPEHATWLAPLLAQAVRQAGPTLPDRVVPIPLHPSRLAERGYNQAWEIARRVASRLGVPASPDALSRLQAAQPQASLARSERLTNLRDAFVVEPSWQGRVRGLRVALVDDVMTTGATLQSAALALQRAGAAAVEAWVFARTPD